MRHLLVPAILVFAVGSAAAQPAPTLTPQPTKARVEATELLIGCASKFVCGIIAAQQDVALVVTKVNAGPLKVGDTPVVGVMTCSPGPLLTAGSKDAPGVELDQRKIRRGSKIELELDVYPTSVGTTTDKIRVLSL